MTAAEPGSLPGVRYSVFISYNHRDRKHAAWLHKKLESYRIPKRLQGRETGYGVLGRKLLPVFQDREELAASADLAQSVQAALTASAALIVICSPNGAKSKWVNEEIRAFTALGRRHRLQCLIVGGSPNASRLPGGDPDCECLPVALFEDGGSEPLAADFSPDKDGRNGALLKLLAGVLDVGYDELRQREAQRRARRLLIIASVSAIGFVLMAALAVSALLARAEAMTQRDMARRKTLTAERTVDFVKSLFVVSDPSEAQGAKITAREILDRGARQIEGGLAGEPTVKAELATTLGEVYAGLGLYTQGDRILRSALSLPVSDVATRARQQAALGEAKARQSDYPGAITAFRKGLVSLAGADEPRPDLRSRILIGLAEAQSATGDFDGAAKSVRGALAADTAQLGPNHPDVARDLEALGLNAMFANRLTESRPLMERALAIRRKVQGERHPKVSEDLNMLGAIAYLQRDSVAAEAYYRRALAIDRIVLGAEHPDVAMTTNNLARIIVERDGFAEAHGLLKQAIAATLRQRPATHDDMAFLFTNQALAEIGLGHPDRAEALLKRAQAAADLHKHRNRAPILVELAKLACERGDGAEGLALAARAAPIMASDYPDDAWRSGWLGVVRGECLIAGGQRAEGEAMMRANAAAVRARWPAGSFYGDRLDRLLAQSP